MGSVPATDTVKMNFAKIKNTEDTSLVRESRTNLQGPHGPVAPISVAVILNRARRLDTQRLAPEVILGISRKNVVFRNPLREPEFFGFQVGVQFVLRVALEICDIQTVFGKLVYLGQEFPRVGNGLFLCPVSRKRCKLSPNQP